MFIGFDNKRQEIIMRSFKKTIALITASVLILASAGCTSRKATDTNESKTSDTSASASSSAAETVGLKDMTFESLYGTQIGDFLGRKYTFDGKEIPRILSDYAILNEFSEITSYAVQGYAPVTSEGFLDMYANYEGEEFETYGAFVVDFAQNMLESQCIMVKMANDAGITLPQEQLDMIEDDIKQLQEQLDKEGVTMEQFLSIMYGEGTTVDEIRELMKTQALAEYYTSIYIQNYQFTEDEIMRPKIRYALYSAPQGTDQETLDAQKAKAQALMEECNGNLDSFEVLGSAAQTNGEVHQYGEIIEAGNTVQNFQIWANDSARKEGDFDVIYAPEYGYFVVAYAGLGEVDETTKQDIATKALMNSISADEESGKYSFGTTDSYPVTLPD